LAEGIDALSQTLQPTADMTFNQEMTAKEISQLTGMPIETVRTQTFRAKRILSRRLRRHFNRKKK
jgi:DNA-directed RNA polymerase specialized sigma24 family protein